MSITNSEHLEELIHECYEQNIIKDVRGEVIKIIENQPQIDVFEAYDNAFRKFSKKIN
jgi:hypothetical protein